MANPLQPPPAVFELINFVGPTTRHRNWLIGTTGVLDVNTVMANNRRIRYMAHTGFDVERQLNMYNINFYCETSGSIVFKTVPCESIEPQATPKVGRMLVFKRPDGLYENLM